MRKSIKRCSSSLSPSRISLHLSRIAQPKLLFSCQSYLVSKGVLFYFPAVFIVTLFCVGLHRLFILSLTSFQKSGKSHEDEAFELLFSHVALQLFSEPQQAEDVLKVRSPEFPFSRDSAPTFQLPELPGRGGLADTHTTQIVDVTSVDQRSSPWPCNSMELAIRLFSSATYVFLVHDEGGGKSVELTYQSKSKGKVLVSWTGLAHAQLELRKLHWTCHSVV